MKTTALSPSRTKRSLGTAVEPALVFLLFLIYAGWPPPDVNEAHYLSKARHYWDPSWCAGDPFLDSADAHVVFYWSCGWLTRWLSLADTARLGRVITWLLLACAWCQLSRQFAEGRLRSVLSAAWFLLLLEYGTMAGEWVVGGLEAKGFAYALVLLGLAFLVAGRWQVVFPMLGAAGAFHVLVGGWSAVAALLAWRASPERPRLGQLLPALALGLVLALPGLVPVLLLNRGVPADTVREANAIYVYQRLSHHLLISRFDPWLVVRHVLLAAAFLAAWRWGTWREPQRRLLRFVGGALAIAVVGTAVEGITTPLPDLKASVMRYYWYRLSDSMLALGGALALAGLVATAHRARPRLGARALVVALLLATGGLWLTHEIRRRDPRPGAVRQSVSASSADHQRRYADWLAVCDWIRAELPEQSCFLTPRAQQTFRWYANRCELVNWKDVPQDAAALVRWWRRFEDVFAAPTDAAAGGDLPHLAVMADRYAADYIVVELRGERPLPARLELELRRVYPRFPEQNMSYAVYEPLKPTARRPQARRAHATTAGR